LGGIINYFLLHVNNACTAADDSGNGHDGTLYGPTCVPGKIGKAFQFDGVSNYIEVPHPGYLANGTVAGWVYFTSIPDPLPYAGLFWFCIGTGVIGDNWDWVNFGVHPETGNTFMFGIFDGGWQWAMSPVIPQTGRWYHCAGTWGSGGLKIYIDGSLKGVNPYTGGIPLDSHHCFLGANTWANFMNGMIDEVRIYNRALTVAEIAQLAQIAPYLPAWLPLLLD
jgi:hypothetical protein